MAACLPMDEVRDMLKELAEEKPIDTKEEARVDVTKITDQDVDTMLENRNINHLSEKVESKPIKSKLLSNLKFTKRFAASTKAFIEKLSDGGNTRDRAIALETILESVKGEIDKINNLGLDIGPVSNDGGITPNLPLHRMAATIGRHILYKEGLRVTKKLKGRPAPVEVEILYYDVGMKAIQELADKGFINIHDEGQSTIKDYLDDIEDVPSYDKKDAIVKDNPAVSINLSAFGLESNPKSKTQKEALKYLTDRPTSDISKHQLGEMVSVMKAINLLSIPAKITFPYRAPGVGSHLHDVYSMEKKSQKARNELSSTPLYIDEDLHGFYKLLQKATGVSGESATTKIRSLVNSPELMASLFKMEIDNTAVSQNESVRGRNLSNSQPVDDLVEYFDYFADPKQGYYFDTFAGRNARLYVDNSVLNPHASKIMRHTLAVEPYTLKTDSAAYKFFVGKVAHVLGVDPGDILGTSPNKDLDQALNQLKRFQTAKNLNDKIGALSFMHELNPSMDFAELVSVLKAASQIRDSVGQETVTSTYPVSSDATASGGLLTLLQALGSNTKVEELLTDMGVLGTLKGGDRPLPDVYRILENKLELYLDGEQDLEGINIKQKKGTPEQTKEVIEQVSKTLYKNIRDLAKKPTMTFIYGQSKEGAEVTLSQELTERTLEALKAGKTKPALKIINSVLGTAYTVGDVDTELLSNAKLKKELIGAFNQSGAPGLLYDMLKGAITNQYLDTYNDDSTAVFNLINRYPGLADMKVMPAAKVVQDGNPTSETQLDKYGVPLQKIFEVRHDEYGPSVLTREGKLVKTVMGVSLIHSADTASMFRSLEGLMTKYGSGVITVHDDMRSSPELIMEAEQNYIQETLAVAQKYDIHEQVLLAAAKYDADIENDPDYQKLIKHIQARKEAKQEALKGFNNETDSIIGDPIKDFTVPTKKAGGAETKKPKAEPAKKGEKKSATTDTTPQPNAATVRLQTLAGDSEIIANFLGQANQAEVDTGPEAKFDPKKDTIILPEGTTPEKAVEIAEHEIVHSWTTAAINKYYQSGGRESLDLESPSSSVNIAYIEKALEKLRNISDKKLSKLPFEHAYKIAQIVGSDTPTGVAELISVLSAEPAVAETIYGVLNEKKDGKLRRVIKALVARAREILRTTRLEDLDKELDIELLQSSINLALYHGQSNRQQNYETVRELQKGFGDLYHSDPDAGDPFDRFASSRYLDSINSAVARGINDPLLRESGKLLKQTDALLQNFPMYKIARDKIAGIYESSSELQALVHTITNENIDKEKKATILSAFSKIRAEKNEITSNELTKFTAETSKLTKAEKKDFYDFVHRMPIHDFWLTNGDEVVDIDAEVEILAAQFNSKDQVDALNSIVDLRVHDKVTPNSVYTVKSLFDPAGEMGTLARKYIVMKTIQEIGVDKWDNFKSKDALFKLTRDTALANAALNDQQDNQLLGDTLVRDEPVAPKLIRAVTAEEMSRYSYEEKSGWKVLQSPTANTPGIVYKEVIDQTYNEGAFTDIKYNSTDVDVGETFKGMKNVVRTPSGYKLILTSEQKEELKIFNDAEQGLVRAMTHAMAIQDSQNIRDTLLQKETWFDLKKNPTGKLEDMIRDKDVDHPWFLSGGIEYHKLPKIVQNKYQPVDRAMSDVDGFNKKIKYVRKDIAHWLTGKTEKALFNDPKLQWATRITKHLVAGAKIGMVILNPMKIAVDNMSNIAYLSVRGVDPLYIQKQYRQISKEFHDYQRMKNKLNNLRVKGYAEPNKEASIKKQIAKLEKQIKAHPANGIVERGFINSLGSDIVLRAGDPSSGMKGDMDRVLKYLFQSPDGDNNAAGKVLMKFANWNVGIEEFLEVFSKVPGSVDSTKNFEKEVKAISRRIREIKTEDDAISYMHQYLNSPDSEFVKMGTYMTDLTDVLSKETLYRFLVDKGVDPKTAKLDVLDAFPNYNENLPTRVKQLSDVGILMFPSYWLRIQRAIFRMAKDQPVNFGTEMTIEAMFGVDAPTIWDANIVKKASSNYGLMHTPWEHVGWNSLFPTNIL